MFELINDLCDDFCHVVNLYYLRQNNILKVHIGYELLIKRALESNDVLQLKYLYKSGINVYLSKTEYDNSLLSNCEEVTEWLKKHYYA
jgi:hypothetical protein